MPETPDVVLIGSGIMSATLAVMLKQLDPGIRLQMIEVNTELAREASDGGNNAGTGHAGLCELSYTPHRAKDGSVPIERAVAIFEQFEHSKQFWSSLVENQMVGDPSDFIHAVPHICFLQHDDGVDFLRARHAAMREHHFFRHMNWSDDPSEIEQWAPLVMEGRVPVPVAATMGSGTEVDFGLLARRMCDWVAQQEGCEITKGWRATGLRREHEGWKIDLRGSAANEVVSQTAKLVFIGAGGGSLPLLQSTGLPEFRGLGGFPIGGQWLICDEPSVVARYDAKVYGATPPSAPSLGAGHLDLRRLNGQRQLMFGPFASWTTRFLKQSGRWSDLFRSLRTDNCLTLLRAGVRNRALVRYLVAQGLQSMEHRMNALREFFPNARTEDWQLVQAGIRVQTIKRADRGAIYFGTEVVSSQDRTLSALLGASPGASVAVSIAMEVIKKNLPHLLKDGKGRQRMKQLIATYDQDLKSPENAQLFAKTSQASDARLKL